MIDEQLKKSPPNGKKQRPELTINVSGEGVLTNSDKKYKVP